MEKVRNIFIRTFFNSIIILDVIELLLKKDIYN